MEILKVSLSFPRSSVGMQSEPLQRLGTQSVQHDIPTETVGTIVPQEQKGACKH
jgi:hypothetical protein